MGINEKQVVPELSVGRIYKLKHKFPSVQLRTLEKDESYIATTKIEIENDIIWIYYYDVQNPIKELMAHEHSLLYKYDVLETY